LTVNLNSNVNVTRTTSGIAVQVLNPVGGSAIVQDLGATINATVPPPTLVEFNNGILVQASNGSAIVTASGRINVAGHAGENAIGAFVVGTPGGVASVNYTGPTTGPGLTSSGANSTGIQAGNRVGGDAIIDASGNISGSVIPPGSGFLAQPGGSTFLQAISEVSGDASVRYRAGTIDVSGNRANGINAIAVVGSASIVTDPGTTVIVRGVNPGDTSPTQPLKPGVNAEVLVGTAAADHSLTVTVASTIQMFGTAIPDPSIFNQPVGIRALSTLDAPISVTLTSQGSITTQGGAGIGILALAGDFGNAGGSVTVNSSGPITTNGIGAIGILADSGKTLNVADDFPLKRAGTSRSRRRARSRRIAWNMGKLDDRPSPGHCDQCVHHGTVQHRDQRD
jgi:hypothetical protein